MVMALAEVIVSPLAVSAAVAAAEEVVQHLGLCLRTRNYVPPSISMQIKKELILCEFTLRSLMRIA